MATITITEQTLHGSAWVFDVHVIEGSGETHHVVTVPFVYYENTFSDMNMKSDELVKESFEFLLAREPKESILRTFELSTIGAYFPEYEEEMKKGTHR